MPDTPGRLPPSAYDPWQAATPLHLLQLLQRLGHSGRAIARTLGVKPAAISMWARAKRPIPERYVPALRRAARLAWDEAMELNRKEVARQPTEDLQRLVQAELGTLYGRWKEEVLFEAGTLVQQVHQQYSALAGSVLQETYRPEHVEHVKRACEVMVQTMERVLRLQPALPSPEDALLARMTEAHEAEQRARDQAQDHA